MGTSFIHDGADIGFWARDAYIEAIQVCLIHEIEESPAGENPPWLDEYKNELARQALPLINGGMSMSIEHHLSEEDRRQEIVRRIDSAVSNINSQEDYFTGGALNRKRRRAITVLRENGILSFSSDEDFNECVNASRWKESPIDPETKGRYLHAFELLKRLLNRELSTTASSPIDYWGSPTNG